MHGQQNIKLLLQRNPKAFSQLILHKILIFEFEKQPLDGRTVNKNNHRRF